VVAYRRSLGRGVDSPRALAAGFVVEIGFDAGEEGRRIAALKGGMVGAEVESEKVDDSDQYRAAAAAADGRRIHKRWKLLLLTRPPFPLACLLLPPALLRLHPP
jgi:hypothetical protein